MGVVIYLDHNATTPILPEVLEAMMPYLTTEWGNPSSAYKFGAKLKSVIETAREQVAELIGAHPMDVIFSSCATESNNAAIAAALKANPAKRHIVTSSVEHSSVLNYCMALSSGGSTPPFPGGEFTSSRGGVKPPLRSFHPQTSWWGGPQQRLRGFLLPMQPMEG
jgi:cysteine desulfurase